MRKDKLIRLALEKWGQETQLLKLVEEMSKLQRAIVRTIMYKDTYELNLIENLAEEIADVEIMLEQARKTFDWHYLEDKVIIQKNLKLKKLEKLIKEENN